MCKYMTNIFNSFYLTCIFFINNLNNYIDFCYHNVNNNNINFFEQFYYNTIIFSFMSYNFMQKIIIKINESLNIFVKKIKNTIYSKTFANNKFKLSTPTLFYSSIKNVESGSKILDFGCGNGSCYKTNEMLLLIKKKNLKITGVDIDKYSINIFNEYINENELNEFFDLKNDINEIPNSEKFDYIIFSESVPLLNKKFLNNLIYHIKQNFMKINSQIIFINNLVDKPTTFLKFIKPKLKYFTTLDFGEVITHDYFDELSNINNFMLNKILLDMMSLEEIFYFFNLKYLYYFLHHCGMQNYDIKQYKIIFCKIL